jgi:peptide/nickel transport system permease protein
MLHALGKLIVDATLTFDYPLAQASFLFISVLVLLANLAADILYAYLDPRIVY